MSEHAGTSCEICGRMMLASATDEKRCVWCAVRDPDSDDSGLIATSNRGP